MELLQAAPAFICCLELGGSAFRGIDLLTLVGNQSVPYALCLTFVHCIEVVPISESPFREVPLY